MRKNHMLARWRAGHQTIGGWLSLGSPYVAELMAHAGFDWLCIDLQHGLQDYGHLLQMLPAISRSATTPLVRVASHDPSMIAKVLDAGAMGVIVPMVNNRVETEAAVAACRYPPIGDRSFGPMRAALVNGPDYAVEANDEIACIVMIETREGIENLEQIVATPGLNGVYIGPADLALALGLPALGDTDAPLHVATTMRILQACKRQGIAAGIHTSSLNYTRIRLAAGFDFVTLGADAGFLMQAVNADLSAIRQALQHEIQDAGH